MVTNQPGVAVMSFLAFLERSKRLDIAKANVMPAVANPTSLGTAHAKRLGMSRLR